MVEGEQREDEMANGALRNSPYRSDSTHSGKKWLCQLPFIELFSRTLHIGLLLFHPKSI